MLEDYTKLQVEGFRGFYRRGTPQDVPKDHFVDTRNLAFQPGNFGIRPGSSLFIDFGIKVNDISEWVPTNGSQPYPVLGIDDNGNFWLWQESGVTNLYTVAGATNFVAINYFGRLFICPTNAGGAVGNLIMLYYVGNTPTIRPCGEDAPVATTAMTATVNSVGGQTGNGAVGPSVVQQTGALNPWNNLLNLITNQNTTVTLFGTDITVNKSNFLNLRGFKFPNIPDSAIVLGIQVDIIEQKLSGTSAVFDLSVALAGIGSSAKTSTTPYPTVPTTATYGGPTDLWGNTSIGGADVNSDAFGIDLQLNCTLLPGNGAVAAISGVTVTVYWETSAGNIAAGTYDINIVYQTDTGFISPPATSPNIAISVVVPADNSSITLNNIPVSPDVPYVVQRKIIIALRDSLGDTGTFYFIPQEDGGVILDNTTTTATISFFVTDLVASADYLFNVRARIPAGQGINLYSARLVLLGFAQPDASTLRLSNAADPETFDQTLESIVVRKDDGFFATNSAIQNDLLYIWKSKGIFVTNDNGSDPVNWPVDTIDDAVGTGFRGLSSVSPTQTRGTAAGLILFIDISGVYLFNGYVQEPALTWKIQDFWDQLTDVSGLSIVIDIKNNRFHITGF